MHFTVVFLYIVVIRCCISCIVDPVFLEGRLREANGRGEGRSQGGSVQSPTLYHPLRGRYIKEYRQEGKTKKKKICVGRKKWKDNGRRLGKITMKCFVKENKK